MQRSRRNRRWTLGRPTGFNDRGCQQANGAQPTPASKHLLPRARLPVRSVPAIAPVREMAAAKQDALRCDAAQRPPMRERRAFGSVGIAQSCFGKLANSARQTMNLPQMNLPKNGQQVQDYGTDPTTVRDSDHYANEYIQNFVEKWDQLINWEARATSEGYFFIETLKNHGARRVLDAAAGTGFHSIRLLEAGFDVASADGSVEMLVKAFENATHCNQILRTVHADWRWLTKDIHERFDAAICLGNSFTHLFSEQDRRKALAEFYAVLNHDGVLIVDQRNYDSILDGRYDTKHTYYYCGENVKAEPEYVDDGLARFRYEFPDKSVFNLNMYPLRKDYTRRLLYEVGFQEVKTYGDFQETYHQDDPDFFIHVATKQPSA